MTRALLALVLVLPMFALQGCAGAPPRKISLAALGSSTPAVIFSAGYPCLSEPDIRQAAARSATALKRSLQQLGFSPVTIVSDPTKLEVLNAAKSMGPKPGLLAYTGHGTLIGPDGQVLTRCEACGGPCRSAMCLAGDERLAVDEVVAAVPATAELAVLLVDACSSAHVDVRRANAAVSVVSASPVAARLAASGTTPLAAAFAQFPPDVDFDCDKHLADWELFLGLNRAIPALDHGSAQPKLRRQVRAEAPALLTGARTSCWPEPMARTGVMPDLKETYTCGASKRSRVEGFVDPRAPLRFDETSLRASEVVALPCVSDSGQCFRPASDSGCASDANGGVCDVW